MIPGESLAQLLSALTSDAPIRVVLGAGTHTLNRLMLNGSLPSSELVLEGEEGAVLSSGDTEEPLLTLHDGAPPIRVQGLTLTSSVAVEGGKLELSNCTVQMGGGVSSAGGRALNENRAGRALIVDGGEVTLSRTLMHHSTAGAVVVVAGVLRVDESWLHDNTAARGGEVASIPYPTPEPQPGP